MTSRVSLSLLREDFCAGAGWLRGTDGSSSLPTASGAHTFSFDVQVCVQKLPHLADSVRHPNCPNCSQESGEPTAASARKGVTDLEIKYYDLKDKASAGDGRAGLGVTIRFEGVFWCAGVGHGAAAGAGPDAEHGAHAAHRDHGPAGARGPDWGHLPGACPLPTCRPGLPMPSPCSHHHGCPTTLSDLRLHLELADSNTQALKQVLRDVRQVKGSC